MTSWHVSKIDPPFDALQNVRRVRSKSRPQRLAAPKEDDGRALLPDAVWSKKILLFRDMDQDHLFNFDLIARTKVPVSSFSWRQFAGHSGSFVRSDPTERTANTQKMAEVPMIGAERRITVRQVLRGGGLVAMGFALLCLIGTMATGALLMHPLLAVLLLVAGLGFAAMSFFGAGT
jgi:hypothetical protein